MPFPAKVFDDRIECALLVVVENQVVLANRITRPIDLGRIDPTLDDLEQVEVVYESMPGWNCDITACATFGELPTQAQAYVQRIETLLETPVSWIGTGPKRDEMAINYE